MLSRTLLVLASRPLEWVNAAAHDAYAHRLVTVHHAEVPVISVGNIALGGTGKTPLVAALARTLLTAGARPAILTRGYRRTQSAPRLVWRNPHVPWHEIGDEPALLARAIPEVPIVVDADRVRGAARAVAEAQVSHLVLDDGFQYWRLARHVDLVATPMNDPLCRHRPRREHPRSLGRASAIVLTGAHSAGVEQARAALQRVAPAVPVFASTVQPRGVHHQGVCHPPAWLAERRVLAAAGIANPHRFFALLATLGAQVVTTVPLPDHHVLTQQQTKELLRRARTQQAVLIFTAKDEVKLPADLAAEVAWLEIEAVPLHGNWLDVLGGAGLASPVAVQSRHAGP